MKPDPTAVDLPERRAADAMPLHFGGAALQHAHVETIDMDAVLPPGEAHDLAPHDAPPPLSALSAEQKRGQLQIVKFKQTLDDFAVSEVSQVSIDNIKRGDVIQIKTIVGSVYIRVVDRMRGMATGVGEILGECRYDLQDQWGLAHMATIVLPFCAKHHAIQMPDGSTRLASRSLKMQTETELPEQVTKLLRESFFTEIHLHANPAKDKLRVIDIGRWLLRVGYRIKGWIDENNRREREKRALSDAKQMQKQLERLAKKQKAGK